MSATPAPPETGNERIDMAVQNAWDFSGYDGEHHKMWVIDQMVRVLLGDQYDAFVESYELPDEDGDGPVWDTGVAP